MCVYMPPSLLSSDVNVKGQNRPGGIHLLKAQTLLQSCDIFVCVLPAAILKLEHVKL